jgi:ABC-type transporter Mla subunit MlaD
MMSLWLVAATTMREAVRRKVVWTALIAGVLLLGIFGVALRLQVLQFEGRPMSPFVRYQVEAECS